MDIARLGLAVDSSQVEHGTATLHQLTGAAGQASAAAQRLAGASQAEAAGQKVATSATQAHTAALHANNAAMRLANSQRANLVFQLQDIGVSLASGMNPLLVAVQQGSQISTIYGPGGLGKALRETGSIVTSVVTKFGPLVAVVGLAVAAIGGMTAAINEGSGVTVSFGDTALATWQVISEGIYTFIQPALDWLIGTLVSIWEFIAPGLKAAGNAIIATFLGAFDAIKIAWGALPAVMGDVAYSTANAVIGGVQSMVNGSIEVLNNLLGLANQIPGVKLGTMGKVEFGGLGNPFEGAGAGLGKDVAGAFTGAFKNDYLGGLFDAISGRAQKLALARQELEGLGGSAKAANENVKKLADDGLAAAAERAQKVADSIGNSIGGAFRSLVEGTKTATEAVGDLLLELAKVFAMQAAQSFSGGPLSFIGSLISGFFGGGFANGGVFNAGMQVEAFARGGVVNRPTLFPMANGAGLMGEAGPEAIMPLRRGPDGRLGVSAANQNTVQRIHVTVGVDVDGSGNILPFVKSVSQETVGQAAPGIVAAAVSQSNKSAPAAMAKYQQQRAGGDYRT